MDIGKPSNSDASSQESNNTQPEKSNEDSTGVGRSYECTFCKRGFTNAQALGGHMNIHRKDKAKAKQKIKQEETSNYKSNLRYMSSQASTTNDYHHHDQQPLGFQRVVEGQMNYQVYMPSPNPNFQTGNYMPLWRPERLQGGIDIAENLSHRMGISPSKDEDGDLEGGVGKSNVKKENDHVDLELRLGHQP